jgi:SARP family transcriptional regulator, regulator of embCAB operon
VDDQPCISLFVYGALRVCVGDQMVIDERFTRHKAKALLALLYLERGNYLSKEDLLKRLWPNTGRLSSESGRLKQTALVLRRALEAARSRRTGWTYVVERDGSYFFNSRLPHQSDLENFDRELKLAYLALSTNALDVSLDHFQRAFALRRGALLAEFHREDWAAGFIADDRERYLQALDDAASQYAAHGENERAVQLLKRAVREDPLRETSAFQLMERTWQDDPVEALRVYRRLRHSLARRLQLEPDAKTRTLFQTIIRSVPRPTSARLRDKGLRDPKDR